jgi:hypothetical protein
MRKDRDGRPLVVGTARDLGVRTDDDISTDDDGMVESDWGGMSVSTTPEGLPFWRRPPRHGGDGQDPLWRLDTDELSDGLQCRVDSGTHAMIEPSRTMELETYEELLIETRDQWVELP